MGWFSGKKKIYVSSVVYNLAGGPKDRVKYIPSTIATKVVSNTQFSMSETLQSALMGGPGMRMRRFAQWARTQGYATAIGQVGPNLQTSVSPNFGVVLSQLPAVPGQVITIQDAKFGEADYGAWADQWMLENHPTQVTGNYVVDFNEELNIIYIRFVDTAVVYEFTPVDFDMLATYLYASYIYTTDGTPGTLVPGGNVFVDESSEFPSTDGWEFVGNSTTTESATLTTTVLTEVTYSDDTPPESTSDVTERSEDFTTSVDSYDRTDYQGENSAGTQSTELYRVLHLATSGRVATHTTVATDTETLPDDVVKTTKVTTTVQSIEPKYYYSVDSQTNIVGSWSTMHTLIYKKNSGNPVLDALFDPDKTLGEFFPFVPIRIHNKFVSETFLPEIYELNKKALKRASTTKYDDLVASVADNASIGDIDYCYIAYGVALNTKEDSSKKYIYKLFQTLRNNYGGNETEYNEWRVKWNQADLTQRTWLAWKESQADSTKPLFGQPEPVRLPYPAQGRTNLNIRSTWLNYDMRISWASLSETTDSGQAWEGAKTGQLRIVSGPTEEYEELLVSGGLTDSTSNTRSFVTIIWQDSPDTYRTMGIWNLSHSNYVYRGKRVFTPAATALADPEESGFIVPLHEGIFRSMSLVDSSQMSMASGYMVLNCYEIVKQKWYQTDWFKIVLVVIVIVITVLSAGTGSASAGLLGTAASVGATLGFAGTIAIVVGTIANAVAAMLLTQLLTMGATALFGEKVGLIIGTIASIIAINVGTDLATGQTLSTSMSGLASAENIMRLTVAAGRGISGYMDDATREIVQSTDELLAEYTEAKAEIDRLWEQNLGFGHTVIDPTVLTDVTKTASFTPESSNVFLSRTLMTGSDIADLTNSMITNFAAMTTSTTLPS